MITTIIIPITATTTRQPEQQRGVDITPVQGVGGEVVALRHREILDKRNLLLTNRVIIGFHLHLYIVGERN